MTEEILKGFTQYEIQPRVLKNKEQQQERTRAKSRGVYAIVDMQQK